MIRTVVVEDDPVILKVNCEFVRRVQGFEVVGVARTGGEAIAVVKNQQPELVLLDFGLPDMGGLQVCHAFRDSHPPQVDIIPATRANDTDTVRAVQAYGVREYLIKPYGFALFRTQFEAYAQRHRRRPPNGGIVTQSELWGILEGRPAPADTLPKGLNTVTCEQVVEVLRNADQPMTAQEVGDAVGLSRARAGHYLDYLHRQGLVVLTVRRGIIGRPTNLYQWRRPPGPR